MLESRLLWLCENSRESSLMSSAAGSKNTKPQRAQPTTKADAPEHADCRADRKKSAFAKPNANTSDSDLESDCSGMRESGVVISGVDVEKQSPGHASPETGAEEPSAATV